MIRSMTGFGREEGAAAGRRILVEMKSLNHRYLEVSLRMPAALSPLETEIKKRIGERFSRGKIEAVIRLESDGQHEEAPAPTLNVPLLRRYWALLTRIKTELNLPGEVTLEMMMRFPDLFVPGETEENPQSLWADLEKTLLRAMESLAAMRTAEGEALGRDLAARMETIAGLLDDIRRRSPAVVREYRQRLAERVRELTQGMAIDEARLHQEVAILAEKSDIAEEVVRLESHIGQFGEFLAAEEAVGRKLDFLIQEMNREINTIGSKSQDGEIARQVIEIKSELAKLREQIQNVE
ncbi:MAG: YicC/YloC family endoribonuclease [Pseudomonadota bacterium]|nr:YicC/YloC family endoribonuclease [Pseudomonadota bacterium]